MKELKTVINYGIEVPSGFVDTIIPEHLWAKSDVTWWEGLPCYLSLDGTKAVIRICTPHLVDNERKRCSWNNPPLTAPKKDGEGGELDVLVGLSEFAESAGVAIMDLEALNEKLNSSEYKSQDVVI